MLMDYTLFGESHGEAVGVLLRHVPAGLPVDTALMADDLRRRRPAGALSTPRRESDEVEILSGVMDGKTTGMPLVLLLRNTDARPSDYDALHWVARPGHADYPAFVRAGGCNDYRGGGHFSGRLTAPLVAAGAVAKTYLKDRGIAVQAHIVDEENLRRRAAEAKADGDSVGGQISCAVTGLHPGLGGPDWFDAVECQIAQQVFSIPAVKAVGFGEGEGFAALRGSQANDALRTDGKTVWPLTNHSGGINGGITNGAPVIFTVTFRPTPTIAVPQQTVDMARMENVTLCAAGRHDACIALRAAPIVEAAAALAVCHLLEEDACDLTDYRRILDALDEDIAALLDRRLALGREIGAYKKAHGLPVRDEAREREVLRSRGDLLPSHRAEAEKLFSLLMALTREAENG